MYLQQYLAQKKVPFREIEHAPTFLATRVAEAVRAPYREFAKTVVVEVDGEPALAVVPADSFVNLRRLKKNLGAHNVRLATEEECRRLFPECELGAWPPVGSWKHIPTLIDERLAGRPRIIFEADDHTHVIEMATRDFEAIENPRHMGIAELKRVYREAEDWETWGSPI